MKYQNIKGTDDLLAEKLKDIIILKNYFVKRILTMISKN